MIIAPINVEYLARGPKVSIASDSNSPGVKENNACDASSGRNRPSPNSFIFFFEFDIIKDLTCNYITY